MLEMKTPTGAGFRLPMSLLVGILCLELSGRLGTVCG